MNWKKRALAFLLCVCMMVTMLPTAFAVEDTASEDNLQRYTVLILDTSGSMYGKPATAQKAAAIKFCESIMNAKGTNHVAIVKLNSSSNVGHEFTTELDTLKTYINSIPTSGGTNINQALEVAGELLDNISTDGLVIKNIVLCSDGIPESGSTSTSGKYTSSDSSYYKYGNTCVNTADALKTKSFNIYTLGFFHSLSGSDLTFGRQLMKDIASSANQYYEVTNVDDLEFTFGEIADDVTAEDIDVSIHYVDANDAYPNFPAKYSNNYFTSSSYEYNHDLAWLTLCVELSAWTADTNDWGESDSDSSELAARRYANISDAYGQMKFDSVKYYEYGDTLNDTQDKVAYSIATKTAVGGATLVAVAVRGGGYGCEWSSNFNVGEGQDFHDGFNTAAKAVYRNVVKYVSQIEGDVKLWVTGYSRGAAVANLLAAKLDDYSSSTSQFDAEDIFTYTFATPQGVTTSQNTTDDLYKNIFNIVNPGDVVPMVAPSGWNFTRYGITKYFDTSASKDTLRTVGNIYYLFERDYINAEGNLKQSAAGTAVMSIILQAFPTTASSEKFQKVLQELLEFSNTKLETNGTWRDIDVGDFYKILADRYGDDFFIAFQYAMSFLEVTSDGKILLNLTKDNEEMQDYLYLFFTLCEIHGIDSGKVIDLVFDLINSKNIGSALYAYLNLPSGISGVATAHTAAVYLSWMSMKEEYTFGFTEQKAPKGTTVVSIACPVDVSVYDEDGNVAATVKDHKFIEGDIPAVIEGEKTTLYFAPGDSYKIKLAATDTGKMNYTITEMDMDQQVVNKINYHDVALVKGRIFEGKINTDSDYTRGKYDLTYDNKTIKANETLTSDFDVTLDIAVTGKGTAAGAGTYLKGDTAELKAYAEEGYRFVGWYLADKLISKDSTYYIRVDTDTKVKCVFDTVCKQDSTCPISKFKDASPTAWYHDGVHYCLDEDLMVGQSATKFAPNATLTRAELAQILYNKAGKPAVSGRSTFTDVPATAWYAKAVAWAQQNNVVSGVGGGKFAPTQTITRESIAAMLYNSETDPVVTTGTLNFKDAAKVSSWARKAMLWATQNGVINGAKQADGTLLLNPQNSAIRAETAAMLGNYYNK